MTKKRLLFIAALLLAAGLGAAVYLVAHKPDPADRYANHTEVSFRRGELDVLKPQTGEVTASGDSVMLSYSYCTVGEAVVKVEVNGEAYDSYIIPAHSEYRNTEKQVVISCKKGDTVTYRISINLDAHFVKTEGTFTVYY